jgi:Uma2 family endonuclease
LLYIGFRQLRNAQMAEPAVKGMTVDEFLRWEDGTDTRYELVGGFVVAMAPPMPAHGRLVARLGGAIDAALRARPPCWVQSDAGLVRPDRNDTCYVADLAVTCEELQADDRLISDPLLIVEVLSPSTSAFDRQSKVADYRRIASVQEILLLDSQSIFAEILRREGDRWITEIVQGLAATLSLGFVPLSISMAELYAGIPLPEPRSGLAARG